MTDGTGTLQWDRSGSLGSMQHGNGAWEAMEEEAEVGGASSLSVTYETPGALQEAFARELFSGAVFVPLSERLPVRRPVHVTFHLPFSDARLAVEGEVVASLPSHIARAGAAPGVSIQLAEAPAELRRRFELASGFKLAEIDRRPPAYARAEPRFPARAPVRIEAAGRRFSAETGDVSYNGMLVLLPGLDLGVGTELRVEIEHPQNGQKLEVDGRVANQTRCDHGLMVVGVQFRYELERVDEVGHFVDSLRSFHHARSLATITGSLEDTPLEAVLETFSSTSNAGTLRVMRGDQLGKLAYQDGEILYATTGLVSGAKALGRLFTWADAQFEFKPEIEPMDDAGGRLPLESAILAAAVQRDELARLDLHALDPEMTFLVNEDLLAAVEPTLEDIGREVVENARMGFPLEAMLDMLPASDALIYKVLTGLIEAGILSVEAR
ncbi:MAG TPA: PilZ domain-containing protein [Myxococcota bacterium]